MLLARQRNDCELLSPSLAQQDRNALSSHFKKIKVIFDGVLEIELSFFRSQEQNLTCEWLHKEIVNKINAKLSSPSDKTTKITAVYLETSPSNIQLDYWLTLPKKSISVLQDGQVLIARKVEENRKFAVDCEEGMMEITDFKILADIGWGGVSSVYLGRRKSNGIFYAIKQIRKGSFHNGKIEKKLIYSERNNSILLRKPFMTKLHYTFQNEGYYYFIMDYVPGRSLRRILYERGPFSEEEAKVYLSEVIIGLETIHDSGLIYRDLKSENLLLDEEGHIKFCDFGISKKIKSFLDLNYTLCGTPETFSPEMVKGEGYNVMSDYYSLGIVAYELITGEPPFKREKGCDLKQFAQKVVSDEPKLPDYISDEFADFVKGLLCKDAKSRLGCEGGMAEIKNHPWFEGINFEKVALRQSVPPIEASSLIFEQQLVPITTDGIEAFRPSGEYTNTLLFFDYNCDAEENKPALQKSETPKKCRLPLNSSPDCSPNRKTIVPVRKFSEFDAVLQNGSPMNINRGSDAEYWLAKSPDSPRKILLSPMTFQRIIECDDLPTPKNANLPMVPRQKLSISILPDRTLTADTEDGETSLQSFSTSNNLAPRFMVSAADADSRQRQSIHLKGRSKATLL